MLTTNIIDPTTGMPHPNPASCVHNPTYFRSVGYGSVPIVKFNRGRFKNNSRKVTDPENVNKIREYIRRGTYNPHIFRAPIIFIPEGMDISRFNDVKSLINGLRNFDPGDTFHRINAHEAEGKSVMFCNIIEITPPDNLTWSQTATYLREWFNDEDSESYSKNISDLDDKEVTVLGMFGKQFMKQNIQEAVIKDTIKNHWPHWTEGTRDRVTTRVTKYLQEHGVKVFGVVTRYEAPSFGTLKEHIISTKNTGTIADYVEDVNHVTISMGSTTSRDHYMRHLIYFKNHVSKHLANGASSVLEAVRKVACIGQVVNTTEAELDRDREFVMNQFRETYDDMCDIVDYVREVGEDVYFTNFGPRWIAATEAELEKVETSHFRSNTRKDGKGMPIALKEWEPFPKAI